MSRSPSSRTRMRSRAHLLRALVSSLALCLTLVVGVRPASAAPAFGSYRWPVHGPVVRAYESLSSPYAAGHRGLDIATASGTFIVAPAPGVVAFAGKIGGALYISIDHPDGVRTTFSWVSSSVVKKGQSVTAGQVIGTTGLGHPTGEVAAPHLHLGAKYLGDYIDPMPLFEGIDVIDLIRLAPL